MLRNYLLTALRCHLRQGGYTAISLAGLVIGLGVATLAFLHVWQETHYDQHLPGADRVHLVEIEQTLPGRSMQRLLTAPGPLAPAAESVTGVDEATRAWRGWYTLSVGERLEFNHPLYAVDTNFPAFVGIEMQEGDANALANPSAALVSASMAERLFGAGPYLGQIVSLGDNRDVEIAGVFKDAPAASHIDPQFLVALNAPAVTDRGTAFDTNWNAANAFTYVRLGSATDSDRISDTFESLAHRNMRAPDGMQIEQAVRLSLLPLTDLHLNGKTYVARPGDLVGNPTALMITTTVALLVLFIACINTINISTARAADRAHEVGLRKVVGASRPQLILQFLGESALLVFVATLLALAVAEILAVPVGAFIGRDLSLGLLLQPTALLVFTLLVVLVVLLSGLYPAFVLANFKPARIFQPAARQRRFSLRSVLVVFQFVTSIGLMVLAGTVWQQVRYLESADLGFDRNDIVILHGVRRGPQHTITLTRRLDQALEGKPGIVHVTGTHSSPSWDYADDGLLRKTTAPKDSAMTVDRLSVDTDFFNVLRVKPLAGRTFDMDYGPDRAQWDLAARADVELPLVLNATAVASMGYASPVDAVGEALSLELSPGRERAGRVVGVVPDFHFKSLKSEIRPMTFFPDPTRFNALMVRVDREQRETAIASIEAGWNQVLPGQAISRAYLDRDLVQQYVAEQRQFTLLTVLAALAIFIAMLGLVGLLSHTVASRRQEISVRKVLGAETRNILRLFLWQFSRPVLLAAVIAWPIAWFLGQRWLSGFAYRVELSWLLFVGAALVALAVTWLLTSLQVARVSRTRPAAVLKAL